MNDATPTPERLVAAAHKLFSEHGFDSASVRRITREADANLGAITYHFGSKEALRDAVIDRLFGALADRLTAVSAAAGPAPARLAGVVHAIFAFFAEHPDAPRLLVHFLAAAPTLPPAAVRHQRRVLEAISAIVRAGVAAGELRPLDPLMVTFTILSQSVWFAIVRRQLAAVSAVPLDHPDMAAAVERHITEVVTRALAPA